MRPELSKLPLRGCGANKLRKYSNISWFPSFKSAPQLSDTVLLLYWTDRALRLGQLFSNDRKLILRMKSQRNFFLNFCYSCVKSHEIEMGQPVYFLGQ